MIDNIVIRRKYPYSSTLFLKKYFKNKPVKGCEIGVFKGRNAEQLLKNLNIKDLYLIDPYKDYNEPNMNKQLKKAKLEMIKRIRKYYKKVKINIYYNKSQDINLYENFDFIYIDGDHSYKSVYEDLEKYYNKLNKRGVLIGDDWVNKEVAKAVIDFTRKNNLKFETIDNGGYHSEYYIIKCQYFGNEEMCHHTEKIIKQEHEQNKGP